MSNEFLKEHPSLKKYSIIFKNRGGELKAIKKSSNDYFNDYNGVSKEKLILIKKNEMIIIDSVLEDIHKTQLDKDKVSKAIDKDIAFFQLQTKERCNKMKVTYANHIIEILRGIKKELGLEWI